MSTNRSGVLIIAPPDDAHSLMVKGMLELKYNQKVWIWDASLFPLTTKINMKLGNGGKGLFLKDSEDMVDLSLLHSIWWRRKLPPFISDEIANEKIKNYCIREASTFLHGFLDGTHTPIINNPLAQSAASNKPLQLIVSKKVGLNIPCTLMTNDPAEVEIFWNEMKGNCIYKAFTSPEGTAIETRILEQKDIDNLSVLRHAPIIVQEKIEKGKDIRVNIFGNSVFAAELESKHPDAQIDWRIDLTAIWKAHDLPHNIKSKLIKLLRELNLDYGCIDMRQCSDGSYTFFEINPSGQFMFIEVDTGQPHCEAMADLLVGKTTVVCV